MAVINRFFSWEGLRPRGNFVLGGFSPTTDEEGVSDLGGFDRAVWSGHHGRLLQVNDGKLAALTYSQPASAFCSIYNDIMQ